MKLVLAVAAAAVMLGAPPGVRWTAAQNVALMEAGHRNKLILLLRKRGTRDGLDANVGAILGLYNRGERILVSRMSMRKDNRILTFGRIGMRDRELYYWGVQPDLNVLHSYFFLTNWGFQTGGSRSGTGGPEGRGPFARTRRCDVRGNHQRLDDDP